MSLDYTHGRSQVDEAVALSRDVCAFGGAGARQYILEGLARLRPYAGRGIRWSRMLAICDDLYIACDAVPYGPRGDDIAWRMPTLGWKRLMRIADAGVLDYHALKLILAGVHNPSVYPLGGRYANLGTRLRDILRRWLFATRDDDT